LEVGARPVRKTTGCSRAAMAKVRSALDELQASRCDVTLALHDRNVALEAFNRDFLHVARIVEGLLRRAELDDLAERVRPSTRRRGAVFVLSRKKKRQKAWQASPIRGRIYEAPRNSPAVAWGFIRALHWIQRLL